jgi:hypothetical protein
VLMSARAESQTLIGSSNGSWTTSAGSSDRGKTCIWPPCPTAIEILVAHVISPLPWRPESGCTRNSIKQHLIDCNWPTWADNLGLLSTDSPYMDSGSIKSTEYAIDYAC